MTDDAQAAAAEMRERAAKVAGHFRKKPVVIEAILYTGENLMEVLDFTGRHPKWDEWFKSWDEYEARVRADDGVFKILTLEGTMEATPGDWIIRGVKGEHYPCKPEIFAATYEPASTPPPAPPISVAEAAQRLLEDFNAVFKIHSAPDVAEGLRALAQGGPQ